MSEILSGAAIALTWVALFGLAWMFKQMTGAQRYAQELHLQLSILNSELSRKLEALHQTNHGYRAELDSLHGMMTCEPGVYKMQVDEHTGARTYKREQLLEDEFAAHRQADGSPLDILEAVNRMAAYGGK